MLQDVPRSLDLWLISLQIPTLAERLGASFAAGLRNFGKDAGSDWADGASGFGKNIRRAKDFGRRVSQGNKNDSILLLP